MRQKNRPFAAVVMTTLVALILVALGSCNDFVFRDLMEGENGAAWAGELQIIPSSISVTTGGTVNFAAKGGSGQYAFSFVSGSADPTVGSIDGVSGHYQAPGIAATEVVRVTDSSGGSASAAIDVSAGAVTTPDYSLIGINLPVSGTGGAPFAGDFTISNGGGDGGQPIQWRVFLSANNTLGLGDSLVDEGSQGALLAAGTAGPIAFGGTWPTVGNTYYLIIELEAGDDISAANNTNEPAPGIPVTGTPLDVVYTASSVTVPGANPFVGDPITAQSFDIANSGTDVGGAAVFWEVYLSTNASYGPSDTLLDSGSVLAATVGTGAPYTVNFTGGGVSWPAAGTYYLVARISALDDTGGADEVAGAAVTVDAPDVRHTVSNVTVPGANPGVGDAVAESFDITNAGADVGTSPVLWNVYVSTDNSYGASDTLLESGSVPAATVGAGAPYTVNMAGTGNWPQIAGNYFLVVTISAADDTGGADQAFGGAVTVDPADVNYNVYTVLWGAGLTAGQAVTGTFDITNDGTDLGSPDVIWTVYASTDTTLNLGTDPVVAAGSVTAASIGVGTNNVAFSGYWPGTAGIYYLFARTTAADDATAGSDRTAGTQTTTAPVAGTADYTITAVNWTSGTTAGAAVNGNFFLDNLGPNDGTATVYWSVYASTDATWNVGDSLVDTGTTALMTMAEAAKQVNFTGAWPVAAASYYLVARTTASDDATNAENATGGATAVSPPDVQHAVSAVTVPGPNPVVGEAVTESFNITNTGAVVGSSPVLWNVYVSTDNSYGASDTLVESGSVPAATVGTGAPYTVNMAGTGNWPQIAGSYFLVVTISAADDTGGADQAFGGPVTVDPPDVDYNVYSVLWGAGLTAGQAVTGSFDITNDGADTGSSDVAWTVYASTDTTLDLLTDPVVATGSVTAASVAPTNNVGFSGYWPGTAGLYYLFARTTAADDATAGSDRTVGSQTTTAPAAGTADYTITSVNWSSGTTTGAAVNGNFFLDNLGPNDGTATVYWSVYASLDGFWSAGDSLVDSGTTTSMTMAEAAKQVNFSGTWPATAASYYLVARTTASDDATNAENATAAPIAVTLPDVRHAVSAVTVPGANPGVGDAVAESFNITNAGADVGTSPVLWNVYVSTNNSYGASDTLLESGSVPAATVGTGAPYTVNMAGTGNWPQIAGSYFLVVTISAADDTGGADQAFGGPVTVDPADVNYNVYNVLWGAGLTAGQAVTGTFDITNDGADAGSPDVTWAVYASTDTTLDLGTDPVVATGSVTAASIGVGTNNVAFSGYWPGTAGSYYLFARTTAADDATAGSDRTAGTQTVTAPVAGTADYTITSVSWTSGTIAGATVTGFFFLDNLGPDDGTATVYWSVYASTDATWNVGDSLVDTGTTALMTAAEGARSINFTGTWPATAASYYLVARTTASDDATNAENATGAATVVNPPNVDYLATGLSNTGGTTAGAAMDGQFQLQNIGSYPGSSTVAWTVYRSTDATLDIPGDTVIAGGTHAAMANGAPADPIFISSTWPSSTTPTNYWIFATISADDDINGGNDSVGIGSITVNPLNINYQVTGVSNTGSTVSGGQLDGQFSLDNIGGNDGSQTVFWTAYLSTDNVLDIPGDTVIDAGTHAAMTSAEPSAIVGFQGLWPNTTGVNYWLFVQIAAGDDTNASDNSNALSPTGPIQPAPLDIDYAVTGVTNTSGSNTIATPLTGTFTLTNTGAATGTETVFWTAYLSTNNVLDIPGDTVIDSSTHAAMANGASDNTNTFSGTWPMVVTNYWLFVTATSADDNDPSNDSNALSPTGPINVGGAPDYDVLSVALTTPANTIGLGTGLAGGFTIQNSSGTDGGGQTIYWTAFLSPDNSPSTPAGDVVLDAGTHAPMAATTSDATNTFSGDWPSTPGTWYLYVTIDAADDADAGFNVEPASPISVNAPDYAPSNLVPPGGAGFKNSPGNPVGGSFELRNLGGADNGDSVFWTVYASRDDSSLDVPGDHLVDFGIASPLVAGGGPTVVNFAGMWPLDFGNYYLIVKVSAVNDGALGNNVLANGTLTPIGMWNEGTDANIMEPNDDYDMLTDAGDLQVTMRPGMSLRIDGSMNNSDIEDVFGFDVAADVTRINFWWSWGPSWTMQMWMFEGPAPTTQIGSGVQIVYNELDWHWDYDDPGVANRRYLDMTNFDGKNIGAWVLLITVE